MRSLPSTKKIVFILVALVLLIFVAKQLFRDDCKSRISYKNINLNDGIDIQKLMLPPDSLELDNVRSLWSKFESVSDSFTVVTNTVNHSNRKISVIRHYSDGLVHHGALIYPIGYDNTKQYPLLLWANGLNQINPSVNVESSSIKSISEKLWNHFIAIPSFRGQALVVGQERYCSDGFFGDAYDGAASDALRFLELIKTSHNNIDKSRIVVCGISRGGTVALLMGARNPMIQKIVAIASPTNFLSEQLYNKYGLQFKYHFLSRSKNFNEIRKKILACSPLFFVKDYPGSLFLIHGRNDKVVPLWNAEKVIEELEGLHNFQYEINDNGHEFYQWDNVIKWIGT